MTPYEAKPVFVHPTCDVHPRAVLGADVRVWNWSQIREGAVIGAETVVGQMAYIGVDVHIGRGCRIMQKVVIDTGVEIGDAVFVGPFVTFTNDDRPRAWTTRDLTRIRWQVGDGATLGASAVVLPDRHVGHHAFVAASSTVTRNVPPHALVLGSPARIAGWVCEQGHRMEPGRTTEAGTERTCQECGVEVLIPRDWEEGRWCP
jgi:UDP-2-acetamido-3-amino-2,3-dideoxy-glucuronate N-acetyltransferase